MFIGLLTICQRIDTSSAIQMAPPPPAHKLSLQMGCVISKYDWMWIISTIEQTKFRFNTSTLESSQDSSSSM
jgi:hypothetical protein